MAQRQPGQALFGEYSPDSLRKGESGLCLWAGVKMPKAYERMRDSFIRKGMSTKAAKAKAARIYNAKHPDRPVTRKHKGK